MKLTSPARLLLALIIIAILGAILTSCSGSKNLQLTKSKIDSSYEHLKDSFSKVEENLEAKFQKEKNESVKTGVVFGSPCPTCIDTDSLRKVLDSIGKVNLDKFVSDNKKKDNQINALKNKLQVNADGSFTAEGNILSVNIDGSKSEKENSELKKSLLDEKRLNEQMTGSFTKTLMEKKKVKKTGPGIGFMIIIAIVAFILGCIFWEKRRKIWNRFHLFMPKVIILFILIAGNMPANSIIIKKTGYEKNNLRAERRRSGPVSDGRQSAYHSCILNVSDRTALFNSFQRDKYSGLPARLLLTRSCGMEGRWIFGSCAMVPILFPEQNCDDGRRSAYRMDVVCSDWRHLLNYALPCRMGSVFKRNRIIAA